MGSSFVGSGQPTARNCLSKLSSKIAKRIPILAIQIPVDSPSHSPGFFKDAPRFFSNHSDFTIGWIVTQSPSVFFQPCIHRFFTAMETTMPGYRSRILEHALFNQPALTPTAQNPRDSNDIFPGNQCHSAGFVCLCLL